MSLKTSLKGGPVIYEIVPPRRDTSRFHTELRGVEEVLQDKRIDAVNIPELMTRRKRGNRVHYSPTTIPPEESALMIKDYKEPIVNFIAPRLAKDELLARVKRTFGYGVRNLVLVGKERHEDVLPGPTVLESLAMVREKGPPEAALGGICIFARRSSAPGDYGGLGPRLTEARRVWAKARAGCDFVTSQINFDPGPALSFISAYREICDDTGREPLTVFISLTTVPTPSILSLLEGLDVVIPPVVRKRLVNSANMGDESVKVATDIFREIVSTSERSGDGVPLGLQIEQVGVNSGELSLDLLDRAYPTLGK